MLLVIITLWISFNNPPLPSPSATVPFPFPSSPLRIRASFKPATASCRERLIPQRESEASPGRSPYQKNLVHSRAVRKPHFEYSENLKCVFYSRSIIATLQMHFSKLAKMQHKLSLHYYVEWKARLDLSWGVFWQPITVTPCLRPIGAPGFYSCANLEHEVSGNIVNESCLKLPSKATVVGWRSNVYGLSKSSRLHGIGWLYFLDKN